MIRKVHLMGNLGKEFGELWEVNCTTVSECLRLIECQEPKFRKYLIDIVAQGANFSVRTGEELLESGEELLMNVNAEDVYITEVPAGSGGWGKIIIGAILIVIGVMMMLSGNPGGVTLTQIGGSFLFATGLSLFMQGVNELLMPKPDKNKDKNAVFSGPVNNVKQGQPVPLLYGELIVGGAPISATFTKTKITSTGIAYNSARSTYESTVAYDGTNGAIFTNEGNYNNLYNPMEAYAAYRLPPQV